MNNSSHDFEAKLTDFGKRTLKDRYLLQGETFNDLPRRVAKAFSENEAHAQRIEKYIANLWFMPATPILSNGGSGRGMPISCFLMSVEDSIEDIIASWAESSHLAAKGGGIGVDWSGVRSIGESIKNSGQTSGIIPFIKVSDSLTLGISQGSLRRGSSASYLHVSHPEIEEFIEVRRPTGGEVNRKCLNIHNAICISDDFMKAVKDNAPWDLIDPNSKEIKKTVQARQLWIKIMTARIELGEPYLLFVDNVNKLRPEVYKKRGFEVGMSNLCTEITLFTGRPGSKRVPSESIAIDKEDEERKRTAVCCLSSLNLETYDEWKDNKEIVEDVLLFLDNVLQYFIDNAPESMKNAAYSAAMERSVGLGVMGWHSYLQKHGIPFNSVTATSVNKDIFKSIKQRADAYSIKLAKSKGPCPDAKIANLQERFSHKISIAPTASISIIAGESSPGIEPFSANVFTHKTLSGSFLIINKYLSKILKEKGKYTNEVIKNISSRAGSVAHLDFLTDEEKAVFKTSYEIDQRAIIKQAADRTPFICQAQSLNVFLLSNANKKYINEIHLSAWELGIKSLYYCRSMAVAKVGNVDALNIKGDLSVSNSDDQCLSCQ